jgi:hypothetical protein
MPGIAKDTGKPVYSDITYYYWMQQKGGQFSIHNAVTCEKQMTFHGEEMRRGNYRGATYYDGELDKLKKVLPESEIVVNVDLLEFKEDSFNRGYTEATVIFCEIILDHFRHANQELLLKGQKGIEAYFKGLTVGRSHTIFGFLMQAIKEAYSALGYYQKTYSGLRLSAFGMQDLLNYISSHRKTFATTIQGKDIDVVKEMEMTRCNSAPSTKTPPDRLSFTTTGPPKLPKEYMDVIKDTMEYWLKTGAKSRPTDRPMLDLSRVKKASEPGIVNEYGFRGDSRSPLVIYYSGGLHPSSLRYFPNPDPKNPNPVLPKELYHSIPHFDPWLHQSNKYYKFSIFLSIAVNPEVALNFVKMCGNNGYIYLIRAVGAIDQAKTFEEIMYPNEVEISLPGGADWESVIATRPVRGGKPLNYCYVNLKNPWRAKEKVLQDQAIRKLMELR